jgi:hypothetical protein
MAKGSWVSWKEPWAIEVIVQAFPAADSAACVASVREIV